MFSRCTIEHISLLRLNVFKEMVVNYGSVTYDKKYVNTISFGKTRHWCKLLCVLVMRLKVFLNDIKGQDTLKKKLALVKVRTTFSSKSMKDSVSILKNISFKDQNV